MKNKKHNFTKKFPLLLVLSSFISVSSFSQNSSKSDGKCNFVTDGTGKSFGLKIDLSVPCIWSKYESPQPNIVKIFSYKDSLFLSVYIVPNKKELNDEQKKSFFEASRKALIEKGYGTLLNSKFITIDDESSDVSEWISKNNKAGLTFYDGEIIYSILTKNYFIQLTYIVHGTDNIERAKILLNKNKTFFTGLAQKTKIVK